MLEGPAQYVMIQLPDNDSLTIINIYAARSSNDRASLWKKISEAKFSVDHIILGGDFNHFEETNRRGIASERQMHRRETTS
jgi:hypothetical protein